MKRAIPKCFIQHAMEAIEGKWRVITLRALSRGNTSFGTLKRAMPSITERMLASQLRELQNDGMIVRTVENEKPLRVTYALTPLGQTLVPIATALYDWGISHGDEFIEHRYGATVSANAPPAVY